MYVNLKKNKKQKKNQTKITQNFKGSQHIFNIVFSCSMSILNHFNIFIIYATWAVKV